MSAFGSPRIPSAAISVRPFQPEDLGWLFLEPEQQMWLGATSPVLDEDYGRQVRECGPCWTVRDSKGWVLGAGGFQEFGKGYAIAWALLAQGIGRDHLAMTRVAREWIAAAPYTRVEALIRDDWPPAARWARLLGLRPVFRRHSAELDRFWIWARPDRPVLSVAA